MVTLLRQRFSGLIESIVRYPVTVAFLIATAVLRAVDIGGGENLIKFVLTCAVAAVSSAVSQAVYERFFSGIGRRIFLYTAAFLLTILFYLSIKQLSVNGSEMITRTAISMFALFIAYIWLAVVNSTFSFSESFMAAFKAFFQSAFFSGIIFLGCAAIIAAIDLLITPVDSNTYAHTANIVFIIIAPLFFLSLIPVYPGRERVELRVETDEAQRVVIQRRTGCPKFLDVLLSYIIIPLSSIFTVILLVYIILNIGGKFWTNNLLEPLLISYSITIIIVTLLASNLQNRFAAVFRMIFPKVLVPIALFQVIASILLMADTGVTAARYFVILYGIFAVLSGCALSLLPLRKSGVVAVLLLVLSAISVIPPVDAFTVSRNSQIGSLEEVLGKNSMLVDGTVRPNGAISEADKARIITAIQYLSATEDLSYVKWLPAGFTGYDDSDFYSAFGFHQYLSGNSEHQYINVYFNLSDVIPVAGFDYFTQLGIPDPYRNETVDRTFTDGDKTLSLLLETTGYQSNILIKDAAGLEIIRFNTTDVFTRYVAFPVSKNTLTLEEATFEIENNAATLKIIVMNAGFTTNPDTTDKNVQMLVFVRMK